MVRLRRRSWPRLGLTVTAALAVVLVGALPAGAQTAPDARGIDRVCPPPQVDDEPDLPDAGVTHGDAILCAAGYGVVTGFEDGTFRPGEPVTRGQVASLLARWLEVAIGASLPVPDEPPFTDTAGTTHAEAIHALASFDVLDGRDDDTFGPGEPLTRGQLAAVILRAISVADVLRVGGPLPPENDEVDFTDIAGTTFEAPIRALAGVGVVQGGGDGAYLPDVTVSRGQLATFLMRAADYLDRHQRWQPTAQTVVLVIDLTADAVVDDPAADDTPDDQATETDEHGTVSPRATAVLTVNAFNGTLAYTLDLTSLPGPFGGTDGATLHVGVAGEVGPVVLQLADGNALDGAEEGMLTGVVREADSAVRFADLVASPEQAYLQIATRASPTGAVRGQLDRVDAA